MSGLAEILQENQHLRERLSGLAEMLKEQEQQLLDQQRLLREKEEALAERDAKLEAVERKAEYLAQRLELEQLKRGGPASQRYIPFEQDLLPFATDIVPPPRAPEPEDKELSSDKDSGASGKRKKKRSGKKPRRRSREDVAHLKSSTVPCRASDEACFKCGKPLVVIGQAESFRIEWVPGHFVVHDVVRDKCSCPDCPDQGILTVPAPYALDRALCGNGLLARVIVDKFADHIPLNRQAKRMKREGFEVGSNTLASWVCGGCGLLRVLAAAVRSDLLESAFLQGDDTGMPVQDGGDGVLRKGRMWAFSDQEQVFYAFTDTKEGKNPAELLEGFVGELLLVDGGSEFNQVVREQGLERGGCWSHLRTYFYDARHHHPAEAALALGTIRDLFMMERELWGGSADDVLTGRAERSTPLVDGFFEWVTALSTVVRPKSTLAQAVTYARNQESTLRLFLEHGELPMHNNLSELMLRQTVVGRKNWLFARSEGGATVVADSYTLIGSCMLQGIDPHEYFVDVLGRIQDHPSNRIRELTPKAWRIAREQGHPPAMA